MLVDKNYYKIIIADGLSANTSLFEILAEDEADGLKYKMKNPKDPSRYYCSLPAMNRKAFVILIIRIILYSLLDGRFLRAKSELFESMFGWLKPTLRKDYLF